MLLHKYAPKTTNQLIGNPQNIEIITNFIINYKKQKRKALLLHGPCGVGKTQSIHTISNQLDLELLELNASDFRNKDAILSIVGNFLSQQSLFQKQKLMLIDEIDGLSNKEDRGGVQAVTQLILESNFPIILTANNPFDSKLSPIRSKSLLLEFKPLSQKEIEKALEDISKKENVSVDPLVFTMISQVSKGDLRGAINDLQVLITNKKEVNLLDLEVLSDRQKKNTIFESLKIIFQSRDLNKVLFALDNADFDIDEAFLWIEENIPYEYSGESLKNAYYYLSRADVFRGRIRRWQYWRFLSYQVDFMTAGIALSKPIENNTYIQYKRTQRILKIWLANQRYQKRKVISDKIAKKTHTSRKKALRSFFYIKEIINKTKDQSLISELELDQEEINYIFAH